MIRNDRDANYDELFRMVNRQGRTLLRVWLDRQSHLYDISFLNGGSGNQGVRRVRELIAQTREEHKSARFQRVYGKTVQVG